MLIEIVCCELGGPPVSIGIANLAPFPEVEWWNVAKRKAAAWRRRNATRKVHQRWNRVNERD